MAFKAGAIFGEAKLDTRKWTGGLKSLKRGTAVVAGAIATTFIVAMTKAIKKGNEFQKAFANVDTLVDETTTDMQALSRELLLLDPRLGTATELTEGLYQAFSAGAEDAEEAMRITTDSATFATAALTDQASAVDVLTTAQNAYGKEVVTTTEASDIFFTTVKEGKITGAELSAVIGQSIPLFASAGIELEELAAGLAAMTKQGVNGSQATTQLNSIINAFLKPSEDMISQLQSMGFASGSAFLEAEGLAGALKLVEDATEGDASEMAKLLPNIRALRGAMALTGVGGDTFVETLDAMESSAGATKEAFEEQELTFATAQNALVNLQIVAGNIGKVFVDKVAVGFTTAAQKATTFLLSTDGMELAGNIAYFVGGAFSALKKVFDLVTDTVSDEFKITFDNIVESIDGLISPTLEGVTALDILGGAIFIFTNALVVSMKIVNSGVNIVKDLVTVISEGAKVFSMFWKALKGDVSFSEIVAQANVGMEAIKNLGGSLIEPFEVVAEGIVGTYEGIVVNSQELGDSIATAFQEGAEKAKDDTLDAWAGATTGFAVASDTMAKQVDENKKNITDQTVDDTEDAVETVVMTYEELLAEYEIIFGKVTELTEKSYVEMQEILEAALDNQIITQEEFDDLSNDLWAENFQEKFDIVDQYVGLITNVLSMGVSAWGDITDAFFQNDTDKIELKYGTDLAALEKQLTDELITQEEFDEKSITLDKDKKREMNAIAKQQFDTKKALDIANVWINAASSVMGWWAQAPLLGPIAGPIFAGTMTGVVAGIATIQTAAIASRTFVPAFAEGGTASGVSRVNEDGGEILNLPDGTIVIPNDISRAIASEVGNVVQFGDINIYATPYQSAEDIIDELDQVTGRRMKRGA